MAEQPGVMIYFDIAEPLKGLSYEEKGRLLEAILDYGQFGLVPEFDGLLMVVWGFIRPKLDVDASKYRKKVVKNTYSSYCAKVPKPERMEYEEWLEYMGMDTEGNRTVPNGSNRHPTITPTITPTTTPSITPSITPSSSAYPSATAASYTSSPSSESWEEVKHRVDTQRSQGNG